LSIILGANLVGLASALLLPFLDRYARIAWPLFREHVWILGAIGAALAAYLSGVVVARPKKGPGRRSSVLRVFSALILGCICLVIVAFISAVVYQLLLRVFTAALFKKYNLILFLLLVLAVLQSALRPQAMRAMSWKKLGDVWMKPPTISAIAVGGFGFVATSDAIANPLLELTLKSVYTNLRLIVPTALLGVSLMILAVIVGRVGRTKSPDDHGNVPHGWFYATFGLAFGGNVALFGLLLDSIFLTVYTHCTV
jgi:hypothetical protein